MNRRKIVIILVIICVAMMTTTLSYTLVSVVFAEVNHIAAIAAISVAIAGIALVRKEISYYK